MTGGPGTARRRVVLAVATPVGATMAGPAIRAVELAGVLSEHHDVAVLSVAAHQAMHGREALPESKEALPESEEALPEEVLTGDGTPVRVLRAHVPAQVAALTAGADVLVASADVGALHPQALPGVGHVVADLYDPFHLEVLERTRGQDPAGRDSAVAGAMRSLTAVLRTADWVVCANPAQRALWIGHLAALGRLSTAGYEADPTLRDLVDEVPFGLPARPPAPAPAPVLRGVLAGVEPDAEVVLWGGGIYDWLDPVTAVRAMGIVSRRRPRARLVFLGGAHPDRTVSRSRAATRAHEEAGRLGVLDRSVVFHPGWVPYAERGGWLLEADVALSLHLDHLETTFSHRTRILDCLWAGLPVVATGGDPAALLLERTGAGLTVPAGSAGAAAAAIERLLDDGAAARSAARAAAAGLTWKAVAEPLVAYCADPHRALDLRGARRARTHREVRRLLLPSVPDRALRLARSIATEGAGPLREAAARRLSNR